MADLNKTIKAMELCNRTDGCGGSKCPYYDEEKLDVPCFIKARFDALELLKEQQKNVRCDECKYGKYDKINQKYQCEKIRQRTWFIIWHDGDFFCKDGEPKDGDGE